MIYIYKFYMYIYILVFCFFVFFIVFQRWLLKSKICNWLDQTNTASQDGISAIYLHQPTNQLHTLVSNSFGIRLIEQKAWVLDRRPCQWTCESYGQMEQTEIRTFGWFRKKKKGKKKPTQRMMCSDTPTDGKSVFPSSLIIKVLVFGAHHRAMNGNWLNSLLCFILRPSKQERNAWSERFGKKSVWLRPFMPYLLWMNFSDYSLIKAL